MTYQYRKWPLIQLIFLFAIFLGIAVVFPGLYTVSSMFWVLLVIDLCITLPLGCVFARLLEPWAQNSPRRGERAGRDLTDYLHRCLYELAEGLIMSALIIVTMATLYAGGATDQIQAWNVVIAALILVGAATAAVRLNRAFAQDAASDGDAC